MQDFDEEIKQLESKTKKFQKQLNQTAENATDYLKAAQCVQRVTTRSQKKNSSIVKRVL